MAGAMNVRFWITMGDRKAYDKEGVRTLSAADATSVDRLAGVSGGTAVPDFVCKHFYRKMVQNQSTYNPI